MKSVNYLLIEIIKNLLNEKCKLFAHSNNQKIHTMKSVNCLLIEIIKNLLDEKFKLFAHSNHQKSTR